MEKTRKPHALLLASPGMGHLIPILELGNRLSSFHGFKATVFVVATHTSSIQSQLFESSANPDLDIISLPPVDTSGALVSDAGVSEQILASMHASIPDARALILSMKSCPDVVIVDLFGTEYFNLAREFGMKKYAFITTNAWYLSALTYMPIYVEEVPRDPDVNLIVEEGELIQIPGCKGVYKNDKVFLADRDHPACAVFLKNATNLTRNSDGFLVNTWASLESMTLASLRDEKLLGGIISGPVYPVGPIVRRAQEPISRNELFDWLDIQTNESVLFVSFGSGGSLPSQQIVELAWGLEQSGQRFVWVLRPPSDKNASEFFFSVDSSDGGGPMDFLPEGFLSRTRDLGRVVQMWAPQSKVLSHKAIGGFLSHCGWNSSLESMINGVPMIAWPLYAEQKLNARFLTEELKIAVRPEISAEGIASRDEIEKIVRKIMEGEGSNVIRGRVQELKYAAEKALNKDGSGSSYNSMNQFVQLFEKNKMSWKMPLHIFSYKASGGNC